MMREENRDSNPDDILAEQPATAMNNQAHALARSLFMIAFSLTGNKDEARKSVLGALSAGLKVAKEKNIRISQDWLYEKTVKVSRRTFRQKPPIEMMTQSNFEAETRVLGFMQKLDWRERLLFILHYGLNWSDADVANLLHAKTRVIQEQIIIFDQQITKVISDLPEEMQIDKQDLAELIRRQFTVSEADLSEIIDLLQQIEFTNQTARQEAGKNHEYILTILAAFCLILLIIFLGIGIWFVARRTPEKQIISPARPEATSTKKTEMSPLQTLPLTWLSSPETIWGRMQNSQSIWQTLYLEVHIIDYGPSSYIGAPRQYHVQTWIKQPDESIQLFGLLSQDPSQVNVLTGGHSFELNPTLNRSTSQAVQGNPQTLVENETLRKMVFPATTAWSPEQGTLRVFNTDQILGRNTLILDWYNRFGQHETRFWLDTRIGMILRLQEFETSGSNLLLRDTLATEFILDENFPPTRLAIEMQKISSSGGDNGSAPVSVIHPTATPAIPIDQRRAMVPENLPERYNLPASQLSFQFSNNPEIRNLTKQTSQIPAQIFADRFLVTSTRFGLPWMLRCQRSPDGYRLAFNTGSDGTAPPDDSLLWLDLRYPERLYEPYPALHVQAFSFSPDSTRIAVFGFESKRKASGIYIIDLTKVENRAVIEIYEASSLVWSPDGESLALVGRFEADAIQEAAAIHIRTSQISFRAPFPEGLRRIPESWPIANWGVSFPQATGGMDACSKPIE